MAGYTVSKRGRYQCSFCSHKSYKTKGGVLTHLNGHHPLELKLSEKDDEIERLKNKPPKIVEKVITKERVVYKEKPKPKPKPKYWYVTGVFCTSCGVAESNVGIPVGQTIENTPHHCGNRTLHLVREFK